MARGFGLHVQISADNVFQHRTLSTGLRTDHGNLWQIDGILHLHHRVSRKSPIPRRASIAMRPTPTVVKTSCSLLTRVIKPGSLTLILPCRQHHLYTYSHPNTGASRISTHAFGFVPDMFAPAMCTVPASNLIVLLNRKFLRQRDVQIEGERRISI